MSRDSRNILSPKGKNVHWHEHEIKELMAIRASEGIRNSVTGTVKDGVVYSRVSKMLAERGVYRTQVQVISKLKYLKKKYAIYHMQKLHSRSDRVHWPFYEHFHRTFGTSSPCAERREVAQKIFSPIYSSSFATTSDVDEKHHEVVASLWDEMDDREISEHLEPVETDDDDEEEDLYSPFKQKQPIKTSKSKFFPP